MADDTLKDSYGACRFSEITQKLTRCYGAVIIVSAATFCAVLLSLLLTVFLNIWLRGHVPLVDLIIGGLIPLIVSPIALYGFVTLVHQLDLTETHLRRLVSEDELTGVYSRRHILSLAEQEWERASCHEMPFSLLLLDVDHFKQINDTYGHEVGDTVLQRLTQVCRSQLRSSDAFGRIGGEEFLVLLPKTGEGGAIGVGEHLRSALETTELYVGGQPLQITISLGAASKQPHTPDLKALLKDADDALYTAKSMGRNQLRINQARMYVLSIGA